MAAIHDLQEEVSDMSLGIVPPALSKHELQVYDIVLDVAGVVAIACLFGAELLRLAF